MHNIVCYLIFLLAVTKLNAQSAPHVPLQIINKTTEPLRHHYDEALQAALIERINTNKKWQKLVKQKRIAIGLVDMSNREQTRFAHINGDEMMYAASLPKIAILLAAMDALEKGELQETEAIKEDMFLMINKSNNQASTRMIDRLGYDKIESVLRDPQYKLYDLEQGGGLWVGKRYAAKGKRNPDPLLGLSHAATANQVCRFYYLMVNGQLVCEERSKQMLDIMSDPGLHHKFVNTLEDVAPKAKLFRKSGSWRNFHSDSILVWGPERQYILVGLVEDGDGEKIMRALVTVVEEVLGINK